MYPFEIQGKVIGKTKFISGQRYFPPGAKFFARSTILSTFENGDNIVAAAFEITCHIIDQCLVRFTSFYCYCPAGTYAGTTLETGLSDFK